MLCCGCGRKRTVSNEETKATDDDDKRCNGDGEDVADRGCISENKSKGEGGDIGDPKEIETKTEIQEGVDVKPFKNESEDHTGKSNSEAVVEREINDNTGREDPPGEGKHLVKDELALRRHRFFADMNSGSVEGDLPIRLVRPDPIGQEGVYSSEIMASVSAFEAILQGPFATYLQYSSKIGGDVAAHAKLVEVAFSAQREFLITASKSSAPSNSSLLQALLKPTSDGIGSIQSFRESHRGSPFFNHLSAVSESIPALGWVAVSPTPAPFVKEMNDAGQFYTNRVLKDWKEKDKSHVEWTKAWVQTLSELQQYVKQYHTTGLCWGGRGMPEGGTPAPPPPPPGPMPPPPPPLETFDAAGGAQDRSALFAEINQGEAITRSLKKVTPDMQTHKNQALRTGPAPFKAPSGDPSIKGFASVKGPGAPADKPSKFTRDGKKWLVEYQKNNSNLVVENAEMNNVVYMYRCEGSTLTVRGKINSVVVDSCRKSSVVFDALVSSIEFINCQSVQMQVLGKVPTITVDKTDGCQMYLSKDSLDVEIVSSKSSEMNVMVPLPNGDYTEYPIPEQYKTTVGPKGLKTEVIESKS